MVIKQLRSMKRGAVMIGQDDWNAIQETLFLVNNKVDKQIRNRENDDNLDFDQVWDKL